MSKPKPPLKEPLSPDQIRIQNLETLLSDLLSRFIRLHAFVEKTLGKLS